jgi:hypothetical protein
MSQSIMSWCQSFGVFWDIENCPIPNGRQASNVVNAIRHFITNKYSDCKTECTFCCACDTRKLDDRAVEGLNRSGVDILHVNSNRVPFKVDADSKLKEGIEKFVDHHSDSSHLFVISGDIDFAPAIRSAKRKGMTVSLIYGVNASQDLRNIATQSHNLYDIIEKYERESNSLISGNNGNNSRSNSMTTGRQSRNNLMSNSVSPKAQSIDTEIRSTLSDRPISSIESWDLSTHSVEQSSSQQPLPQMVSNLVPTVQRMPQQTVQQLDSFRLQAGQQSIRQQNYSNPQQLSPEFAEKAQTIQSITGVERTIVIRVLHLCNGDVTHAINSLYPD